SVGERRTAPSSGPELWSGLVEHVYQDAQQRYVLLRLDAPSPGVALVGISDAANLGGDGGVNVSVCRYFYGDDVTAQAAESETSWRTWLATTFGGQDQAGQV